MKGVIRVRRRFLCCVLALTCSTLLLLVSGCEDPAKHMTFDEAMEEYEWDRSSVRDYFFEEYGSAEIFDMLRDRVGPERILEWVLQDVEFEAVLDVMHDIYSDHTAEDIVLDAVIDRYY